MKRIGIRANILIIIVLFFLLCTAFFLGDFVQHAATWAIHPANKNIYNSGTLASSGSVVSEDDVRLYTLDGSGGAYADSSTLRKATLHTIGDRDDNIVTGVVKSYKSRLIGYDFLNGVYNPTEVGNTITLTLDSETCKAAYEALGSRNGTVGIYNYETGEILCMVSKPSFDPNNVPDLTSKTYEGVYVNRLTAGVYAPGSIFKVITAFAAIEEIDDINYRQFTCNGGVEIDGEWITCAGNHGTIGFEEALAKSCNAAFAVMSLELGKNKLANYAAAAGVGKQFTVNGVKTSRGRFNVKDASESDLAWAGIGQYTDLVNPMQYMIFMGAIAGEGKAVTPYYIKSIKTSYGFPQYIRLPSSESRMLSADTAVAMKSLLRNNAVVSYNDSSFPGMALCAKTGTAQVDDGNSHAWFTGFLDNPDTPLAFVVVVEHGGGGSAVALPIARTVLNAAIKTFQ